MANKLLLCISTNQATAARWRGGRLTQCTVFENSEAGAAKFRDYAAASGGAPAFVIVDATEEDYRFETLPHASSTERAQMVERKLRQYYRGSIYCAASLIGRDSNKRRDDRYLFSALTNAELITPWLSALTQCGLPIGGIYLLPMVTAGLVDAVGNKTSNLLLVTVQSAGTRLTFFRGGTFRLSRLSRSDVDAGARDKAVVDEISNTRLYLHALRAATLDEAVNVVLLDHADTLEATAQAIRNSNANMECRRVGPAEIASSLKLDPGLLNISPAVISLQLLGTRIPDNNLASSAVTAGYRRYQSRRQLYAASALVATIGICWSGYNIWEQISLNAGADEAARRTASVNAEYQAATGRFPSAPTTAENLRKATELADQLQASAATPERFLQVIGRALTPSPEIALADIAWQHRAGGFESNTTATDIAARALAPAPGANRQQSGQITGQVRNFNGDFRTAIDSINGLAERLRQDAAVENVRIVQLPLNASPTLALSGNTADNPAQAGAAEFKMVIVLRQPT